jgi:hypothetical protein
VNEPCFMDDGLLGDSRKWETDENQNHPYESTSFHFAFLLSDAVRSNEFGVNEGSPI